METHIRAVGWLRIVWSLLGALFWLYVLTAVHSVGAPMVHDIIQKTVQSQGSISLPGSPSAPSPTGASSSSDDQAAIMEQVTAQVVTVLTVLFAVFAFFQLVATYSGWALMAYRPWARPFNIVVSVFDLVSVPPLSTAIAVYSLWVLFRPETVARFARRPPEENPTHL